MSVKAIPDGYHSVTPYLFIRGAAEAIEFYKRAFNAVELMRMPDPSGKIMHAEIRIGDSPLMLSEEMPEMHCKSPQTLNGCSGSTMLYVEDVDALYQQAVDAGATPLRPVENQFWGDRMGTLIDPFGQQWSLGTHIEDVPPEQMGERFEAAMKQWQQES